MGDAKKATAGTPSTTDAKQAASVGAAIDVEAIRQVVAILEASEVTRIDWSNGREKLSIRKGGEGSAEVFRYSGGEPTFAPVLHGPSGHGHHGAAVSQHGVASAPTPGVHGRAEAKPRPSNPAKPAEGAERRGHLITSPFVGTFYRAAGPDQPPYVEVGSTVKKGQVLCIVEAMKLMNELESDVAGRVAEILVQNATPVEFGQALFRIEPS